MESMWRIQKKRRRRRRTELAEKDHSNPQKRKRMMMHSRVKKREDIETYLLNVLHNSLLPGNYERYRKAYFCPIRSCANTRAIKKLSSLLKDVHRIRNAQKRHAVLAEAKELGVYNHPSIRGCRLASQMHLQHSHYLHPRHCSTLKRGTCTYPHFISPASQ